MRLEMRWLIAQKLICVDKLLGDADLRAVQDLTAGERYRQVDVGSDFDIWRLNHPCNPVVGTTMFWPRVRKYRAVLEQLSVPSIYPMGNAYDVVLSSIDRVIRQAGMLNDAQLENTAGIIATVYRYGPGKRLIWHNDDNAYLMGFSFYCSPWNENWGGFFAYQDSVDHSSGTGRIVAPRSNRLLAFHPDVRHSVTPCSPDANIDRLAISGFLVDLRKAESLFEAYLRDACRTTH